MNASNTTSSRLSFRHTVGCIAALALMTTLAACDKKGDAASTADGGGTSTTTTPAAGGKMAKSTVKLADLKTAWKAEIDNTAKMKDPMDKKVDAFLAKVPKPATDSGRKKVWYALDGDKCSKVELDTKDGSLGDETTDKSNCGM